MSTPALEQFLARLYTDARFRTEFLADRGRSAAAANLAPADVADLMRMDTRALELTARTFDRKRRRQPSAAVADAEALRQGREARIRAQNRQLWIAAYEDKLRFPRLCRPLQIRERLIRITEAGMYLRQVVERYMHGRRGGLETMHRRERSIPVTASGRDVGAEGDRF